MARIVLEPGELFEHRHSAPSITQLVEGRVVYEVDGTRRELATGESVTTPPNQSHTLVNLGESAATIVCYHR